MAPTTARSIAAEVRRRLPGVPVKKLHKLLYYAQAHHLATFGEPLFSEAISAWDMGPVVGQLWRAEKRDGVASFAETEPGEAALNTVGYVTSVYGGLTGQELERLTHTERPWFDADRARREKGERSATITTDSIRAYFVQQTRDAEAGEPAIDQTAVAAWLSGVDGRRLTLASPDTAESLATRRR